MKAGRAGDRGASRIWDVLLPLVLLGVLTRLWLMPLGSSFWVDEMGTVFVVQHGPDDPSLAVAPQVPQSIYYLLPRATVRLLGFSELAYRLPSLLAMGAALWLIARLAARLVHPRAGWFAAFACLSLRGFDYQAADARPYGLGTLVACAGLWLLVRWLDRARWRDALYFAVLAALMWRVQLVFWPFYLVFGIYAVVRLARSDTAVTWKQAMAVLALVSLWLSPVLLRALALYRQAGAHVVAALPSARDLLLSLKIGLIAVCGGGAWVVSRVSRRPSDAAAVPVSSGVLIVAWWLCQPLGLFAFSWLTGNSVFLARYLWLALPGCAMLATWAASRFVAEEHWKPLAVTVGVGVLLLNGQWSQTWPWHHNSDWRGAARKIAELGIGPNTPVICPSPFVEARPPVWRPDYPLPGFLYAPLSVYPVPGRIRLFPFEDSAEAEAFARELLPAMPNRFVVYGGQGQVDFWRDWFAARPELAGWHDERFRTFGDVEVVVFREGR